MRRLLLAGGILAALTLPTLAANLPPPVLKAVPLKAPVQAPCSVTGCTGFYGGFDLAGSGTGVNILNLSSSLNANGTFIGADAGWQYYDGTWLVGVHALVTYDVATGSGDIANASVSSKLFAFEGVDLGGNLFAALGVAPPQTSGFLSTVTSAVPVAHFGACQGMGQTGYCVGAGLQYYLPNTPLVIHVDYYNAQWGTSTTAPNQTINNSNVGLFGVAYHF